MTLVEEGMSEGHSILFLVLQTSEQRYKEVQLTTDVEVWIETNMKLAEL